MSFTVDELIAIRDLPEFLRTEHFYNDMQHAMLVILFRHAMTALKTDQSSLCHTIMDNLSLYFYIHFLNEEEGMCYKVTKGLLERDSLIEHSEAHVKFLDYWRDHILVPYKNEAKGTVKTLDELTKFYNLIIKHIDETDISAYGADAVAVEDTRSELARIAMTNMPMSPFMSGAYQTVGILDQHVAGMVDRKRISPKALDPIDSLNLIPNVGRILPGTVGSLRDRFVAATRGDQNDFDQALFNVDRHADIMDMNVARRSAA